MLLYDQLNPLLDFYTKYCCMTSLIHCWVQVGDTPGASAASDPIPRSQLTVK